VQGNKEGKAGMLSGLFRISSKRLDPGVEPPKEQGKGSTKGQAENGGASPRGWVLPGICF